MPPARPAGAAPSGSRRLPCIRESQPARRVVEGPPARARDRGRWFRLEAYECSSRCFCPHPSGGGFDDIIECRLLCFHSARDLEGMVSPSDEVEFCVLQRGHQLLHLLFIPERVVRSLDEEHWFADLRKVRIAALIETAWRMKGITKEDQAADLLDSLRRNV